jgi:rSAM/selenodomain-associated transferase 2
MTQNTTLGVGADKIGISVIIPVYCETGIINGAVREVRRSAGEAVEILVCDGGPGFSTLGVVDDPAVVRVESPAGRGRQMNAGAAVASGEVLLFLHADTRLPSGWPDAIRRGLSGPAVAGAFRLAIDSPRPSLRLVAWAANWRTRIERIPYGDQGQFVRAEVFREVGGFPDIAIMEDVELFRTVRRLGLSVTILEEFVRTSPRRWEREGVLKRTLTNWWLRIRHRCGTPAETLARHYRPSGPGDR